MLPTYLMHSVGRWKDQLVNAAVFLSAFNFKSFRNDIKISSKSSVILKYKNGYLSERSASLIMIHNKLRILS